MAHSTSSLYYRPSARHSLSSLLCFDECWSAFDTSKFASWQHRRIQLLLLATHWLVDSLPQLFRWIKLARIYSPRCISSSDSRAMDTLNSFARSAQSICSALLLYYPLTSCIGWGDCTCVLRLPKTSTRRLCGSTMVADVSTPSRRGVDVARRVRRKSAFSAASRYQCERSDI